MIGGPDCFPGWFADLAAGFDPTGDGLAELVAARERRTTAPTIDRARMPADDERIRRARAYLAKVPEAVAGQGGHAQTYQAACALVHGFALDPADALALIIADYNPRCLPTWDERELVHKVNDATEKAHDQPRGYLLARGESPARPSPSPSRSGPRPPSPPSVGHGSDAGNDGAPDLNEDVADPRRVGRAILAATTAAGHAAACWRAEFYRWRADGQWRCVNADEWRSITTLNAWDYFDMSQKQNAKRKALDPDYTMPKLPKVTRNLVADVINALAALTRVSPEEAPAAPAWIRGATGPDPAELVPLRNGILHLPTGDLIPPTPHYFNLHACPFEYDAAAPEPAEWLAFLRSVWGEDAESVGLLQEWFGYLITPDKSQQKILLMLGPPRSGKGTISRVLQALVGPESCCNPSFASLADSFGLAPLVGPTVALVDDARVPSRSDANVITGHLLSISGNDAVDVNRKHALALKSVKLGVRFVVSSNEIPQLPDRGRALPKRWSVLQFSRSFVGSEDTGLEGRLLAELPGIFLWAVEGWRRLRERGRFTRPAASADAHDGLEENAAPVGVFIEDRCEVGQSFRVAVADLFEEWKRWCAETGRKDSGTREEFGRQLRAAGMGVKAGTVREGNKTVRGYIGIRIREVSDDVTGVTGDSIYAREEEIGEVIPGVVGVSRRVLLESPVTPVTNPAEGVDI
jgi:putative DNA primase/helicase